MPKKEFNIAAARLIYDVIGADGYVSDRELDILEGLLNDKYGLSNPERAYEVNKVTFCDALKTLQEWDNNKEVNDLLCDLKLIAGVGRINNRSQQFSTLEGYCSLSEAWLLFAIEYAIRERAVVFSVCKSDYRFARSEIIYLENNNSNNSLYEEMIEHYGEYKAKLELFGIRLIYIPIVCSYLKKKREQLKLRPLMRYVSPFHKYEDQDAQKIVDNIDKIKTSDFAKDLFSQDVKLYNNLSPSFLIKIGTSIVAEDKLIRKSNFMLIPIEETIGKTLQKALAKYQDYTLDLHIPERKIHGRPFRLHGFDRTFLNFVMSHILNTEKLTELIFDFSDKHKCVCFKFDDKRTVTLPLGNKQMCLYLTIILYSTYKKGFPIKRATKKKTSIKMGVESVFSAIYNRVKIGNIDLYDGKGSSAVDISRIITKMKDIPQAYHVVIVENRAWVNYPCKDIVYIKFSQEQKLLEHEIGKVKEKNTELSFESVCCQIFH
jgi:hypothetical protein